jgi:leader peptidase (prepilin peptidase)/N-methyltransferase
LPVLLAGGLLGLIAGSFISAAAWRMPRGEGVARGRSRCPTCGEQLSWHELVPLLSWLAQGGRCRHCGAPISAVYPLVELAAAGVGLWGLVLIPGWVGWVTALLGWALLFLAVVDLRHLWLPDSVTLPLILAGLGVIWLVHPERLLDHAVGAAAGFLSLAGVRWAHMRLRGEEGLGLGDAKLYAAAGSWVAWMGLPSVLLIAAAAGLAGVGVHRLLRGGSAGRQIPFGPWLALGFWLVWLYGPMRF